MTITVNKTHDLVIQRHTTVTGFMLEKGSWKRQRVNDFQAQFSTGGDIKHSDLDFWRVQAWEDWSGGFGQEFRRNNSDPTRFYSADNHLETTLANQVVFSAQWLSSDAGFAAYCFRDHGSYTYAGGATSIRRFDPTAGTWANSKTGLGAATVCIEECGGKLVAALGSAVDAVRLDTDPDTWNALTGIKATFFKKRGKYLWRSLGASLYHSADTGDSWTGPVAVGDSSESIVSLAVHEGRLVVGKASGLYVSDANDVPSEFSKVTPDEVPNYSGNFKLLVSSEDGWLYFNILSDVYRISQITYIPTIQLKTPKLVGLERYGLGVPVMGTASPKYTYVLFNNGGTAGNVTYFGKWNGNGWHNAFIDPSALGTANACYYSRLSARIFMNLGTLTLAQRVTTLNDSVYPDYEASVTRYLYLEHFDASVADIKKTFRDVKIVLDDATANVYCTVDYQTDKSGTWVNAGSAKTSPQSTVTLSPGRGISAKDLWLRIGFITNSGSATPKLKGVYLSYMVRPTTLIGGGCEIRVEDDIELLDGTKSSKTIEEYIAELRAISDAPSPILVYPPDEVPFHAIMNQLSWREREIRKDVDANNPRIVRRSQVAAVSFVPAYGGQTVAAFRTFENVAGVGTLDWTINGDISQFGYPLIFANASAEGVATTKYLAGSNLRPPDPRPLGVTYVGFEIYLLSTDGLGAGNTVNGRILNAANAAQGNVVSKVLATGGTQLVVLGSTSEMWGLTSGQINSIGTAWKAAIYILTTGAGALNIDQMWCAFYWEPTY